ncbi:MAG: hypothetical protein ABIS86_21300 [Streptosporangiaceae bacterium]
MEITNRIVRILPVEGGLLAADVVGRVHRLDRDLKLVRSSPVVPEAIAPNGRPVYAVTVAGEWVIGKDNSGNIFRWSLPDLDLVDVLDAAATCDPSQLMDGEEPSPTMSRGIGVWNGKVYLNNGYRQVVILDLESFQVEQIVPSFSADFALEWFCTDRSDLQAVADKAGFVHFGSLENMDFPVSVELDAGNIHRVIYDTRHHRWWATQDAGIGDNLFRGNGVMTIDDDGTRLEQLLLTRNDLEFLVFAADFTKGYAGGFDGDLYVLDNSEPGLRLERTLEGVTSHQLTDGVIGSDGDLYTLSQDGEILRFDDDLNVAARASFRRGCVWDIRAGLEDRSVLYAATDDGVAVLRVEASPLGTPSLRLLDQHSFGFGFTRRLEPAPDGYFALTWDRKVLRAGPGGEIRWVHDAATRLHTLTLSPCRTRVLVAADSLGLELDAETGAVLAEIPIAGAPVWASAYLDTGERVLATREGTIHVFDTEGRLGWQLELPNNYPKRMWVTGDSLFVTGGSGIKEISVASRTVTEHWHELLENTVDNGVLLDGVFCAIAYGGQLVAFDRETREPVGFVEDLPDFPKGITSVTGADGTPYVIVGGRGGYLNLYRLDGGPDKNALTKVRQVHLPRGRARSTVTR